MKRIKKLVKMFRNPYFGFLDKLGALLGFYKLWDGKEVLYNNNIKPIKVDPNKGILILGQSTLKSIVINDN